MARGAPVYALAAAVGPVEALANVVLWKVDPNVFSPGLREGVVDVYLSLEVFVRAMLLGSIAVLVTAAVVSRGRIGQTLLRTVVSLALMFISLLACQVLLGWARPWL